MRAFPTMSSPMKILVNCCPLLSGAGGAGGAGSYVHALLEHLPPGTRVLASPENRSSLERHAACDVVVPEANHIDALHGHLNWADVYLSPLNGVTPEFLSCRIPILATLLDLQHAVMPHFFDPAIIALRHRHYGMAVARADTILTISEYERRNIRRLYGKQSVHVTYLSGYLGDDPSLDRSSVDEERMRERLGAVDPDDFLLFPAIPWPHKNHYRLIQAFHRLRRRNPAYARTGLVLTGGHDHPLVRGNYRALIEDLGLERAVAHTGFLSDAELVWLFRRARLLTFPSLYEGFGIPVCDAMKLGAPVIAARAAAVPEVGGDAIAYFRDPLDPIAMADDIAALLDDPVGLAAMVERSRAEGARFSAAATAQETMAACAEAMTARAAARPPEIVAIPDNRTLEPPRRLTILVDATMLGGAQADGEADLARVEAFWRATAPYKDRVHIVGLFTAPDDEPTAALERWKAVGGRFVLVFPEAGGDLAPAGRFVREEMVESDCLLFLRLDRFDPAVYREVGYACAMLDAKPELNVVSLGDGERLRIKAPPSDVGLIQEYRSNADAPAAFLHGRLIRIRSAAADGLLSPAGVVQLLKEPATLCLPLDHAGAEP